MPGWLSSNSRRAEVNGPQDTHRVPSSSHRRCPARTPCTAPSLACSPGATRPACAAAQPRAARAAAPCPALSKRPNAFFPAARLETHRLPALAVTGAANDATDVACTCLPEPHGAVVACGRQQVRVIRPAKRSARRSQRKVQCMHMVRSACMHVHAKVCLSGLGRAREGRGLHVCVGVT